MIRIHYLFVRKSIPNLLLFPELRSGHYVSSPALKSAGLHFPGSTIVVRGDSAPLGALVHDLDAQAARVADPHGVIVLAVLGHDGGRVVDLAP